MPIWNFRPFLQPVLKKKSAGIVLNFILIFFRSKVGRSNRASFNKLRQIFWVQSFALVSWWPQKMVFLHRNASPHYPFELLLLYKKRYPSISSLSWKNRFVCLVNAAQCSNENSFFGMHEIEATLSDYSFTK